MSLLKATPPENPLVLKRRTLLISPLLGYFALFNRSAAVTVVRQSKSPLIQALELLANAHAFDNKYPPGTDFETLSVDDCVELYDEAKNTHTPDGALVISDDLAKAVQAELLRMM